MPGAPRVSVLMTAYDAESTLRGALESALSGSLQELEVVVVDDGSRDATAEVAESLGDPRVRVLRNPGNRGLPYSRRRGAAEARAPYLAILDSDDLAHPRRFEKQADALDAMPSCAVIGAWARIVSPEDGSERIRKRSTRSHELRARMLFNNVVKDSTAMARTALVQRYDFRDDFVVCELTDLWQRMAVEHDVANLPEVLGTYVDHPGGISKRRADRVRALRIRLAREQLDRLGVRHDEADLARHFALSKARGLRPSAELLDWTSDWFRRLRDANRDARLYPEPAFTHALGDRWFRLCRRGEGDASARLGAFVRSPLCLPAVRHKALEWPRALLRHRSHGLRSRAAQR